MNADVSRVREIAERLERVRSAISSASLRGGRGPVQLVAVSKTVPVESIRAAHDAGQRVFGENRVQEAVSKIHALSTDMPDVRWHLIGQLQTNKVGQAVQCFSLVESVDSVRLAIRLDARAGQQDTVLPVLIEVNVGGEASKSGFSPADVERQFATLARLHHLEVRGLMTVVPQAERAEDVRHLFREMREIRDRLHDTVDGSTLTELSMGMSEDFEVAIEEGATMVRIGRAIFGERPGK